MVAYTPDFCLPYLEGSDSPCLNTGTVCDPSSAWCDLIALVEAQLNAFDDIAARTGTAVPLAKISFTPPVPIDPTTYPTSIPFDIIEIDTDNMVNFEVEPAAIVPNRNGIYEVILEVTTETVGANTTRAAGIRIANEQPPFGIAGTGVAVATQTTTNGDVTFSASTLWLFTDSGPLPRVIIGRKNLLLTAPIVTASLTALWHAEVPA
jgi:hypothetical protein